jgi:hypothetical protein
MTQNDSQTKEIGGYFYTVAMLDPLSAEDLLVTVVNVIGPSLGAVAGAMAGSDGEDVLDRSLPPVAIEQAITGFCQRVTQKQMREVIALLTPVTTIAGAEYGDKTPALNQIFSEHFRGRLGKLNEWLVFAVKVQLGDFFDSAALGISDGLQLVRAAASPSQSSPSTTDEPPG